MGSVCVWVVVVWLLLLLLLLLLVARYMPTWLNSILMDPLNIYMNCIRSSLCVMWPYVYKDLLVSTQSFICFDFLFFWTPRGCPSNGAPNSQFKVCLLLNNHRWTRLYTDEIQLFFELNWFVLCDSQNYVNWQLRLLGWLDFLVHTIVDILTEIIIKKVIINASSWMTRGTPKALLLICWVK